MNNKENPATDSVQPRPTKPFNWRAFVTALFGWAVIGSGLWRFLSREGGQAGLWFGIVMGGLALVAATLFLFRMPKYAAIVTWVCLAFVGGWFCYEALIKKGLAVAETRQLVIIGLTTATAAFHLIVGPQRSD